MAETRKIQLEATVDATGAKAGFKEVSTAAAGMAQSVQKSGQDAAKGVDAVGNSAKKLGDSFTREEGRLRGSIQRSILDLQTLGKSASEKFEARIQLQGLDTTKFQPYIAQLRALEAQQTKTGVSAAQTAAAMRMVPAQMTDIVTQLAGGQNPLLILTQQGGQLKDMFGGIGPAAKALGGYVLGLINPFTLTAAAVGTLGLAFYQGAKETTEYNKALILTGNYLGTTVSQLQVYAKQISSVAGTQGAAAEALTALASSGKVATASLTDVGTAVVLMNRVLGQSVDEATKVFVQLADEPTKASAKLNESMHYLNLATFERIRALEEQGQKEEAAALAQRTYATETTARLQKVEAQTGSLERGWRFLADGAKAAWDAMLGIGRAQSVGDALATAQKKLSDAQAQVAKGGAYAALYGPLAAKQQEEVNELSRKALRESENAAAESEKVKTNAAQIGASQRVKILTDETKTNADKRKQAIADLNRDFQTLGKATSGAEYDKLVANINDKYKDPKTPKAKAFTDDATTKTLQSLRESAASLKDQLDTDEKLTASEQQRAKFVQQIADIKGKGTLTADQKSLLAAKDQILAQLDINVALEKQIVAKEKQRKLDEQAKRNAEEFARQVQGINISIESASRSRSEQYDRQLSTMGLGSQAREEVESQKQVRREYEAYRRQLTKDAAEKNQLGSQAYIDEVARIDEALSGELARLQKYWDDRRAIQADGIKGAQEALANYIDEAYNSFDRANRLLTGALEGFNSELAHGLVTGDFSGFKDYGDRIAEEIISGILQQQITGPIAQWLQQGLQDPNGGLASIIGGLTGTQKTGENWLGGLLGTSTSASGAGAAAAATTAMATSATTATASLAALAAAAASAAAAMGASSAGGITSIMGSSGGITSLMGAGSTYGSVAGSFFADGGFTGPGGKYQPAGIVHAGEGVLSQREIRAIGGEAGFNALRRMISRGYSEGGYVQALMASRLQAPASAGATTYGPQNFNLHFNERANNYTVSQAADRLALRQREARRHA